MRQTSPQQAEPFLASKWQHLQFLLDIEEMQNLFTILGPCLLYTIGTVLPRGSHALTIAHFLEQYSRYIQLLRQGLIPHDDEFRSYFTCVMSRDDEALQAVVLDDNREIIKPRLPLIQLQLHRFDYSTVDGKIRPQVFGKDTISWGLQASYPQLFQDPISRDIHMTYNNKTFTNSELFHTLWSFLRQETIPARFTIDDHLITSTIRIGKKVGPWINLHPELKARGLFCVIKD